jgi:hypothetical protein
MEVKKYFKYAVFIKVHFLLFIPVTVVFSQEPIFNTNQANSLFTCPSMISFYDQPTQIGFNYLSQNDNFKSKFNTYLMTANADLGGIGRFGIYGLYDKPNIADNKLLTVHGVYSFAYPFNNDLYAAIVLKGGYTKSDYSLHLYSNRFNITPLFSGFDSTLIKNNYFDFGSGIFLCARKWNFSFFTDNLNHPTEFADASKDHRIPIKFTFLGGLEFKKQKNKFSFTTLYQHLGKRQPIDSAFSTEAFDHLSFGIENIHNTKLITGIRFRYIANTPNTYFVKLGWVFKCLYLSYDYGISRENKTSSFYHQVSFSYWSKKSFGRKRAGHMYNLKGVSGWRYVSSGINNYSKNTSYNNVQFSPSYSSNNQTGGVILKSGFSSDIKAGVLTAGELNDFGKWKLWNDIAGTDLKSYQDYWKISPLKRYSVQVVSDENRIVADAIAVLKDNKGKVMWTAHTDNTGKAELWANLNSGEKEEVASITVTYDGNEYTSQKPLIFPDGINSFKIPAACNIPKTVDIAFVVDATGSMEDEIEFLKVELKDIIEKIKTDYPELALNLGSVFYRCPGNSYVTKKSDFSDDINTTIDFIGQQAGGEGGDEAVEQALDVAVNNLSWSDSARARIIFLVLDEPPAYNNDVIRSIQKTLPIAASKGIRIVPVVGSGAGYSKDKNMEYLMRSIALATNGTYVFLTDHSNIGDTHTKPTTDEYDVEMLNNLLMRLVYQYTFVPSCDKPISTDGIQDTMQVIYSPIIAHEVIDSSRILIQDSTREVVLIFTDSTMNDTLMNMTDYTIGPDSLTAINDSLSSDSIALLMTPESFKYYPNPTSGALTIETEGKVETLYLADISGKLLERYTVIENIFSISLENYPTGIYFLQMPVNDKWHSGKVLLIR